MEHPVDLLAHMNKPFDEGGHNLAEAGYVIEELDLEQVHEEDHCPEAWWSDALIHAHDDPPMPSTNGKGH